MKKDWILKHNVAGNAKRESLDLVPPGDMSNFITLLVDCPAKLLKPILAFELNYPP